MNTDSLIQEPAPGTRTVVFRGDTVTFRLALKKPQKGTAWIRTNIGHGHITRKEIIRQVDDNENPLGRDWFDTPMHCIDDRRFQAKLALCEGGHFEAKCYFLRKGETTPVWPPGANAVFNVEPADACCANVIYNAFVRQFGPNKAGREIIEATADDCIQSLDKTGYTVIPASGTFRDVIAELDFIFGGLGCRILMLLPIHPTPTTYGRMGRFGSPYAALSFTAVDPALAVFDPHATPLGQQFIELVDAVHQRNAKIFIDIAINHTGWAASLHESHPQWLTRSPEGRIEVPGAWGVRWEDLTKLDYIHKDLWQFMADVFIKWCHRGVDGFRCDAGYMIPLAAWKYIVARVKDQYPDTVFLLEGLGGKISVTRDLLNIANLNWAYSELFQNYDRGQVEYYLPEAIDISSTDGITVHFAETHDNPRLAVRSHVYARMRTALCALFSNQGAFGFANGVEWFATAKINVHDAPSLNWGADTNQVAHIKRLNRLLEVHPAFHEKTELKMVQQEGGNHIVLLRHHIASGKKLLVVVNLDDEKQALASWNPTLTGFKNPRFMDLLTESPVTASVSGGMFTHLLAPGQVLCLSQDENDLKLIRKKTATQFSLPQRIELQRLRAKALEVVAYYQGTRHLEDFDPDLATRQLRENPIAFCTGLNHFSKESRVITWQWPQDIFREVMIPPGHFLMVRADCAFRARLFDQNRCLRVEKSLACSDGFHFTLFAPLTVPKEIKPCTLKLAVYSPVGQRHEEAPVLVLPWPQDARVKKIIRRSELLQKDFLFLATNNCGGMLRMPISWGKLKSRYDALLAANLSPEYPENRWVMFTRCRAWLVFQGYSQEINIDCLDAFSQDHRSRGYWRYHIPTGQGEHVTLTITVEMLANKNALQLNFLRHAAGGEPGRLPDSKPITIIMRPDIENRSFHDTTKAYIGPEQQWPKMMTAKSNGFNFRPDEHHHLQMEITRGEFVPEPEWYYMVHRAMDEERGLDPNSDLFSPGFFRALLEGNEEITLSAGIKPGNESQPATPPIPLRLVTSFEWENDTWLTPLEVLQNAMDRYVVKRGYLKTVIAGYPWFLDWGRDALIFARGLIADHKTEDARLVLKQFGQFEQNGTLPNMIVGKDAGNRDTSDAPLWFFVACADIMRVDGNETLLEEKCGTRSIRQILSSIAQSVIAGTPNGVRMEPDSGLIFSPAHFTWMDTNQPAGTPREGYPIEIQALWYAALRLLSQVDTTDNRKSWQKLYRRVQASILDYFWLEEFGYLSDCLHASAGQPLKKASRDDALRPNQLLAVTLGAVRDLPVMRKILAACEQLLVPGAIRSLANRPIRHPLYIVYHSKVINDPHHPYQGKYIGDEETQRKPAYHNGTAWTWMFPSFCEAWAKAYGNEGKGTALAWLSSSTRLMDRGCVGHIPEILDGDAPHIPRGCDAQAWGVSEWVRVWIALRD